MTFDLFHTFSFINRYYTVPSRDSLNMSSASINAEDCSNQNRAMESEGGQSLSTTNTTLVLPQPTLVLGQRDLEVHPTHRSSDVDSSADVNLQTPSPGAEGASAFPIPLLPRPIPAHKAQFPKVVGSIEAFLDRTLSSSTPPSVSEYDKCNTFGEKALAEAFCSHISSCQQNQQIKLATELFDIVLEAHKALVRYAMTPSNTPSHTHRDIPTTHRTTSNEDPESPASPNTGNYPFANFTNHSMVSDEGYQPPAAAQHRLVKRVSILDILQRPHSTTSTETGRQGALTPIEFHRVKSTAEEDEDGTLAAIAEFEVISELGHGTYGTVFLVADNLNTPYALKTLNDGATMRRQLPARTLGSGALVTGSASISASASAGAGVSVSSTEPSAAEREIAVMKRLHHQNVVRLFLVIEDPAAEKTHLVMQYIENGPPTKMEPDGTCSPLELSLAFHYMKQVSLGLSYLHTQGIIHRDIKPENILIGKDDTAYVADFGVSAVVSEGLGRKLEGTVPFMSPEMLEDAEKYGKASDVWAFGVTLYCMIFGQLPFQGRTEYLVMRATLQDALPIPAEANAPKECVQLLQSLLEKDPEKRMTLHQFRHNDFAMAQFKKYSNPLNMEKEDTNASESDPLTTDVSREGRLHPTDAHNVSDDEARSAVSQVEVILRRNKSMKSEAPIPHTSRSPHMQFLQNHVPIVSSESLSDRGTPDVAGGFQLPPSKSKWVNGLRHQVTQAATTSLKNTPTTQHASQFPSMPSNPLPEVHATHLTQ